jgi:hypothetical protein
VQEDRKVVVVQVDLRVLRVIQVLEDHKEPQEPQEMLVQQER